MICQFFFGCNLSVLFLYDCQSVKLLSTSAELFVNLLLLEQQVFVDIAAFVFFDCLSNVSCFT